MLKRLGPAGAAHEVEQRRLIANNKCFTGSSHDAPCRVESRDVEEAPVVLRSIEAHEAADLGTSEPWKHLTALHSKVGPVSNRCEPSFGKC